MRWLSESHPVAATWLAWPCRSEIWPNGLAEVQQAYANVINALADFGPLRVLVRPNMLAKAQRLCTAHQVTWIPCDLDD